MGTFPYKELIIGECPQLRRIDYKAAGLGKQAAVAGFDPALCSDPEAFLTKALKALAWFKVEDEPPPEPEPPSMLIGPEMNRDGADISEQAPAPTSDVPWLHPEVPAYVGLDGQTVIARCPFCGLQHRHHGFSHRLAHCTNPAGKGYKLLNAGPASPEMMQGAMVAVPGYASGAATSLAP